MKNFSFKHLENCFHSQRCRLYFDPKIIDSNIFMYFFKHLYTFFLHLYVFLGNTNGFPMFADSTACLTKTDV